jgi:hypothetical protein
VALHWWCGVGSCLARLQPLQLCVAGGVGGMQQRCAARGADHAPMCTICTHNGFACAGISWLDSLVWLLWLGGFACAAHCMCPEGSCNAACSVVAAAALRALRRKVLILVFIIATSHHVFIRCVGCSVLKSGQHPPASESPWPDSPPWQPCPGSHGSTASRAPSSMA